MRLWLLLTALGACTAYQDLSVELPPNQGALLDAGAVPWGFEEAQPFYRSGHRRGLALRRVTAGSLVDLLKLRAGDVIREFDGIECDDLLACRAGAMRMEEAMRRREPFELTVERDGRLWRISARHAAFAPFDPEGAESTP